MTRSPVQRAALHAGGVAVQWAVSLTLVYAIWRYVLNNAFNPAFFANPSRTWKAFKADFSSGVMWQDIQVTSKEVLVGFGLGMAIGIVFAMLIGLSPTLVGKVLEPVNTSIYAMPKFAIVPILFVWIGNGFVSRTWLVLLTTLPVVTLYTLTGIRTVDPATSRAIRMMGGSRRQLALKLLLPHTSSYLFTSIAVVIPHALAVAVGAEILFGASDGLGGSLLNRANRFNSAGVLSTLITASILSALLLGISAFVRKRLPVTSPRGSVR